MENGSRSARSPQGTARLPFAIARAPSALLLSLVLSFAVAFAIGCEGESDSSSGDPTTTGKPHEAGPQTCSLPPGTTGSPRTVEDVVAILNGLPKPVTVPCFLQTLDRPLAIEASNDGASLQPAYGPAYPRILIFSKELIITVVGRGAGQGVIELGVMRDSNRSLKAEIGFPVAQEILPAAPYERIATQNATRCGICHFGEELDTVIDFTPAFSSKILPPLSSHLVDIERLRELYEECDPEVESDGCAFPDAIFGYGDVVHRPFSEN